VTGAARRPAGRRHRGARRLIAALAVALPAAALALAGCGTADPSGAGWTLAPGAVAPDSPVEGVVVRVETTGLNDFRGFRLRTDQGDVHVFTLGRLENAAEFPPSHLPEHMANADRLRVFFRVEDGALVAYRIEHAYEDGNGH
jgi:hypothetical protein